MSRFKIPIIFPTVNKTIRFPEDLIKEVEEAIAGKQSTFSAFVIEAVKMALRDLEGK